MEIKEKTDSFIHEFITADIPKIIWEQDFLGTGDFTFNYPNKISFWKRFWTKVFFGSKWKKVN